MTEQVSIKWNEFEANIVNSYKDLRRNIDFSDVTLVCENHQQIKAHRVILSACSPFFRSMLLSSKHSHSMIYMRGVNAKDLVAIVDYIYHGEAEICKEDLDGFLALADSLQLKGLSGSECEVIMNNEDPTPEDANELLKKFPTQDFPNILSDIVKPPLNDDVDSKDWNIIPIDPLDDVKKITREPDTLKENKEDKTDLFIETITNGEVTAKCTVCGRENKGKYARKNMRKHLQSHTEGVPNPCNQCGKLLESWKALKTHIYIDH